MGRCSTRSITAERSLPEDTGNISASALSPAPSSWISPGAGRFPLESAGEPCEVASEGLAGRQEAGELHLSRSPWIVVDGRIAAGLLEAKLLRARAVLATVVDRAPKLASAFPYPVTCHRLSSMLAEIATKAATGSRSSSTEIVSGQRRRLVWSFYVD